MDKEYTEVFGVAHSTASSLIKVVEKKAPAGLVKKYQSRKQGVNYYGKELAGVIASIPRLSLNEVCFLCWHYDLNIGHVRLITNAHKQNNNVYASTGV